ncbi:conserved hypothetical protein [Culex quinquefasciatus]|uniref:Uncharacterized protein n=1 Tax=Culex quinquefasciatus TaxID=7176 RepID=B0X4F9_CULQU|nr:conserved hypothetical protein [Culex quinquefasciatus]|eukprot:XP_001864531.1 conserved hypothetical protein [Culex quinquefasciatus]
MKVFRTLIKPVSTPTGVISHFVNLQVVVPEAFILGSGELHVDMGSTINLVCIIEKLSTTKLALNTTDRPCYMVYYTSWCAQRNFPSENGIKVRMVHFNLP